jgi:hypothetical protein
MRRTSLSILVLVACLSGCSKHATDTTEPPPPPVPGLVATQPPARSPSALYDSDIWGQFDRPLDARTVTTQNVYLKLDAQRIPITVSYDAVTQRVSLKPTIVLELQRTYTAEFSTAIKGSDGTPIESGVFFQFTTNSLRRPVYDFPLQGALEGPVTTLCWGGTQGPTNNLFYELYVSPDSAAVEARTAPMLLRHVFTRFVPAVSWPMGTTLYWSVTAENLTTHERLAGAVRSFRTVDAATPLDSVTIAARDHGSKSVTSSVQFCNNQEFRSGGAFNGALHWDVGRIPAEARLQSVSMRLNIFTGDTSTVEGTQPSLWMAQNDWTACLMNAPGPPFTENTGFLASATTQDSKSAVFSTDRLAGLLEALMRGRGLLYGTIVRANHAVAFHSTFSGETGSRPSAVVRFYRVPPAHSP